MNKADKVERETYILKNDREYSNNGKVSMSAIKQETVIKEEGRGFKIYIMDMVYNRR